jgi:hypothetical protein
MRRLLVAGASCALLGLLAVAAPALSLHPYRPDPVEFELRAPPDGLGTTGARGFVSREIRAPKRFNLVGFAWEGSAEPAIAVRVRADGEAWSRWTPVPSEPDGAPDPGGSETIVGGVSQPVWAGQADYLQYRLSRRPPGLRLHFVNTTGTATVSDRIETAVRGVVSDGVVALASLASAGAETRRPKMISRGGWGAEDCEPRTGPQYGSVDAAFVHHTVTANRYSRSETKSMVLAICRYHRNTNGWNDIGYNFLVDRFGRIIVGRAGGVGRAVVGAHAEGFNSQSTGVAGLGSFGSKRLSREGVRGMARLLRWKLPHHGTPVRGRTTLTSGGGSTNRYPPGEQVTLKRISGHRDVSPTSCPGNRLYEQLRDVRRKASN